MAAEWVILHGGALGDLVLTLQLALRLPGVDSQSRLHVIARSNPGHLANCRPAILRRSLDGLGAHWLFGDGAAPPPPALAEAVRGRRVLAALGGADEACHARLTALQPAARYSFDPRPQPGLQRHITQQWQTALEAQGLLVPKCTHQRPGRRTVGISPEIRARGVAILREIGATGEPLVLLHPGSGGREKCWPLANFVAVAEALRAGGATPCFLLGPVEIEWWHEAELAGLGRRFPVLRLPAADTLAAALAAAQVVIANDSGPAHLAALLGTATIAVFGPTSASVWQPLGRHVRVVAGDPQVSPSDWGIPPSDIVDLLATG